MPAAAKSAPAAQHTGRGRWRRPKWGTDERTKGSSGIVNDRCAAGRPPTRSVSGGRASFRAMRLSGPATRLPYSVVKGCPSSGRQPAWKLTSAMLALKLRTLASTMVTTIAECGLLGRAQSHVRRSVVAPVTRGPTWKGTPVAGFAGWPVTVIPGVRYQGALGGLGSGLFEFRNVPQ